MSHFTSIKTEMVEAEFITQALDELGYQYQVGPVQIRGFSGRQVQVDIKILTRGYDVGLRKTDAGYEIVADWWGVKGLKREAFQSQLLQRYAYHATRAKLEAQGFTLVNEEAQEGQRIHLVLRRMG